MLFPGKRLNLNLFLQLFDLLINIIVAKSESFLACGQTHIRLIELSTKHFLFFLEILAVLLLLLFFDLDFVLLL